MLFERFEHDQRPLVGNAADQLVDECGDLGILSVVRLLYRGHPNTLLLVSIELIGAYFPTESVWLIYSIVMEKIAIITGASRGLGKSMALHIARTGHDVLFSYHSNKDAADKVIAEIEGLGRRAAALQLDVAAHGSFDVFADNVRETLSTKWKRTNFDVLINNAGSGAYATIADTTHAQFDAMVNEHLKGPFFLTQKLMPLLKDGGRIVNISSGLTRFSYAGYAAYAAMKGGVEVLTRYLATELGSRGISVNTIAPGAIETDFGGGAVRDNKDLNALIASHTVLGRVGLPDDVGSAVASLLNDNAGWINAQRIEVSGGMNT